MARFFSRNLGLLDRLFQFDSGSPSAPSSFDVASPIQPVFDVSRVAQLGMYDTQGGGFFHATADLVHGLADTQTGVDDAYSQLTSFAPGLGGSDPTKVWIWLMRAALATAAGVLTSAQLSVAQQEIPLTFNLRDWLIESWTATVAINAAGSYALQGVPTIQDKMLPFPLTRGSVIEYRSVSAAAGTVQITVLCWVGPYGVYPPPLR